MIHAIGEAVVVAFVPNRGNSFSATTGRQYFISLKSSVRPHEASIEAAGPLTSHISKAPAPSSPHETAPALASSRAAFGAERTSAPVWGASAATAICARPFGTGVKARTVYIGLTTCDTETLVADLAKVALRIVVAKRGC